MRFDFRSFLVLIVLVSPALADDELPKTLLTERGKLLASEDFVASGDAPTTDDPKRWGSAWRFAVGKWEVADGVLKGIELAQDHHPAHASYSLSFQDVVLGCDVRLDGCRMTRIRMTDDTDYVCSAHMTPAGFSLFKSDHDHTGPDKDELLSTRAMPLAAGEWHRLQIEILGNEAVATLDGHSITGAHPLIGAKKNSLRFAVVGGSASYRRLRVWQAQPNPDWAKTKLLLSASDK